MLDSSYFFQVAQVPDLNVLAQGSSTIRVEFGFVSGASTYYITLNDTAKTQVAVFSSEIVDNKFTKDLTNIVSGNTYSVSVVPEVDSVNGTAATKTVTLGRFSQILLQLASAHSPMI